MLNSLTENLSKDEIPEFPHFRFKTDKRIGEGSYGVVERVLDTKTNELFAIKTMKDK